MAENLVNRALRGYEKIGDKLLVEVPLRPIDLKVLQEILGLPEDDPVYHNYPVDSRTLASLRPYVDGFVDLAAYDFFVEYWSGPPASG